MAADGFTRCYRLPTQVIAQRWHAVGACVKSLPICEDICREVTGVTAAAAAAAAAEAAELAAFGALEPIATARAGSAAEECLLDDLTEPDGCRLGRSWFLNAPSLMGSLALGPST